MRLVVSEKNIAAKRIAEILAHGKPHRADVAGVPVYAFTRDGEEWASIGLKGHILGVDFPPSWGDVKDLKKWKLASLPTLVRAPVVKVPAEKEIISALGTLAKKSDAVIIATDYDREGELIGADARGIVLDAHKGLPVNRARFSAITRDEIERAFRELGDVSDELAAAGGARQDIDLVWGAVLTRYLTKVKWAGVGNARSAGRVQTPTLKLIVDREKERMAFVPEDYWTVSARLDKDGAAFSATHEKDRFKDEASASAALESAKAAPTGTVKDVERKRRTIAAPTPFNTTALQAVAASEGLSPARAMRVAESLYMDGLISYPRVDNTVYPPSLDLRGILRTLSDAPEFKQHAKAILDKGELRPTRGEKETTDHPPIHPTGVPSKTLKPEERKLYEIVVRRFLGTLMDPSIIEGTKVTLDLGGEPFVARGDVTVQQGFRAVYHYGTKKEEHLPPLAPGDSVAVLGVEMEAKQTQPPSRYSQGKLIQEMEKRGLGTKATRHDIIQTLYDRRYAVNDPVEPTKLGVSVIDALSTFAERITTPDMTAELEKEMDDIANGRAAKENVVNHSRDLLAAVMEVLLANASEVGELLKTAADEDSRIGACPKCGSDLRVKSSPRTGGQFVGCSAWPECDVTYPLPAGKIEPAAEPCPMCSAPQVTVIQARTKPRTVCLDPACPTNKEPEVDLGACKVCAEAGREGHIMVRRSPRTLKRFARCTNYDVCNTSYPLPQHGPITATGELCEPCGSPRITVTTARGPWTICLDPACPSKADAAKSAKPKGGARGGRRTASAGRKRAPKKAS